MKNLFTRLFTTSALLLAAASAVSAQDAAPSAAYDGPRFPGGPDSLRALVYRSTRLAVPGPAGRMLVQFNLKPNGQPHNLTMVRPPQPLNPALVNATASALNYLEARMPAWQPGAPDPKMPVGVDPKISLAVDFTTPQAALPYGYPDQEPVFASLGAKMPAQRGNNAPAPTDTSPRGLMQYMQRQVRYPPAALRQQEEGVVYAYFEVAESGAIEHPEILGTAGQALDSEVLQMLQHLPAATTPALIKNQPARVFYVMPFTFRITQVRRH